MFRKYVERQQRRPDAYEAGKRVFDEAVQLALKEDFRTAYDHYTLSINLYPNPVAYMNRGRISAKRLRYKDALDDMLAARKYDLEQGIEFQAEINKEIEALQFPTELYRNGTREKLLEDYEQRSDFRYVARRIFCSSFKVKRDDYVPYNSPLVKFHFFDELDNIQRFEFPKNYPEATELLKLYPAEFIQHVIDGPVDAEALFVAQSTLHQFLCSYDAKTMHLLRRFILYDIHEVMLENDYYGTHQVMFGVQHGIPDTPTPEVIREAVEFIEQRAAG